MNSIRIPGSDVVVRVGRYGPYLERGDQRASVPEDTAPDELTATRAEELLARPAGGERPLGRHPETGREIVARDGRYGPYVTEVLPEGEDAKPRTASLFASMSVDTVTLEDAVRLLTLPRMLEGADGEEILVSNGRYGPFVKKGAETRSLASEEQLLTLTVDEAEAILARPKERRGRGAPKPPLKELGADPASGQAARGEGRPIRAVRDGRRDEREPATRRRRREPDAGACAGAARRAARQGPRAAAKDDQDAALNGQLTQASASRRTMHETRAGRRPHATSACRSAEYHDRGTRCGFVTRFVVSIPWKDQRIAHKVRRDCAPPSLRKD